MDTEPKKQISKSDNLGPNVDSLQANDAHTQESSTKPAHRNKLLKVLYILAAVIVIGAVGLFVFFGVAFEGGINSMLLNRQTAPDPNSAKLVNARNDAIRKISDVNNAIKKESGLTYFDSSTGDVCATGQNNGKVHEGYGHECIYAVVYYYGFNGEFRDTMLSLDKTMQHLGLTSDPRQSIRYVINEYYDKPAEAGRDYKTIPNGVMALPMAWNYDDDFIGWEVDYAEKRAPIESVINNFRDSPEGLNFPYGYYKKIEPQDLSVLFPRITSTNRYVLAIMLQKTYFKK